MHYGYLCRCGNSTGIVTYSQPGSQLLTNAVLCAGGGLGGGGGVGSGGETGGVQVTAEQGPRSRDMRVGSLVQV